jgi:drug/metabolite transporter (DMT)-like permease
MPNERTNQHPREADLDVTTITVMLLASMLHAGWHSLVKFSGDQIVSLAGMGLVAAACAAAAIPLLPPPAPAAWPILVVSAALHVGYKLCLASAYGRGDLGYAFPLARGVVPLFATLLAFAFLGQVPTRLQALGIVLVSVGVLLLTLDRLNGGIKGSLVGAAVGAGIAVACYSVLDAHGTRVAGDWAAFTAWLIVLDNVAFVALSRGIKGRGLWRELMQMRTRIAFAGALGILSFCAFLWALSRSPAGPVSALRETSVLFALLIGVLIHGEPWSPQRLLAAVLIVGGVAVIAI